MIVRNCSSVVLVLTFHARSVYNFIIKKANFPAHLVPLYNGVWFLFCRFLKPGVTTNGLKCLLLKSKKVRRVCSKQDRTFLLIKRWFSQYMTYYINTYRPRQEWMNEWSTKFYLSIFPIFLCMSYRNSCTWRIFWESLDVFCFSVC